MNLIAGELGPFEASPAYDLTRLARIAAWGALVLALVAGLGWALGAERLFRLRLDYPAMVPPTALAVSLLAIGQLMTLAAPGPVQRGALLPILGAGGIALWALAGKLAPEAQLGDDRVALATAGGISLITAAHLSRGVPALNARRLPEIIATIGLLLTCVGLDGFLFNAQDLNAVILFSGLSVPTALSLCLLFLALLLSSQAPTWMLLLLSTGAGGQLARRIMPAAVFGPVALCFVALIVTERGYINANTRLAGLSIALVALAGLTTLRAARVAASAELERLTQDQRLRQVIDAIPSAVFVFSDAARLVTVNERAEALLGGRPARAWLEEAPFHSLEDREPLTGAAHPFARLMHEDGPSDLHAGRMTPDGDEQALHFTVTRRIDPSRRMRLTILTITDETSGWAMRAAMARSDRLDAIGALSGGIAHEVANILGVIQLAADTGVMQRSMEGRLKQLEAIRRACARGAGFTSRLLAMTRDNAGGGPSIDVATVLHDIVSLARQTLPAEIALEERICPGPCPVACTASELETAALNLILNSRNAITEAGMSEGRITLALERHGDTLRLSLRDTGPGIEARVLPQVKEPFFTTRRETGGTGLGLAMIDSFAQKIGGDFRLSSPPGGGALAELDMPLAAGAAEDEPDEPSDDLLGVSVLLVEDDPEFRDTLAESLIFLGARIYRAEDGPAALEHLDNGAEIDLLMTDITLPKGLNGYALASEVTRRRPGLPVIYLSGYAEGPSEAAKSVPGLRLRKPVRLHELPNAVRLALLGL
ncbi:ATP-binding protein [Pseudoroseicyclus sp. CXY001]|uniref:ATP-binding protein n=1 Tax=Pseudoroseicyclus sp. CXY001 TaxID=3242492 RepID=UPI003570C132